MNLHTTGVEADRPEMSEAIRPGVARLAPWLALAVAAVLPLVMFLTTGLLLFSTP